MSVAPPRHFDNYMSPHISGYSLSGQLPQVGKHGGHVVHCFLPEKFLDFIIPLALDVFYILSSSVGLSFYIKFNHIPLSPIKLPETGSQ